MIIPFEPRATLPKKPSGGFKFNFAGGTLMGGRSIGVVIVIEIYLIICIL
jgi:hypothetical protein